MRGRVCDPCPDQPPDAENRTSGGVEGTRGESPVSPSDRIMQWMAAVPNRKFFVLFVHLS